MGWNIQNKSLQDDISTKAASIGPGAPVNQNPGFVGRPYRDSWDIERAYKEGMQKVTWVSRCIDAIAGNQARLPVILRADNSPHGEVLKGHKAKDNNILSIFNTKANIGENSFIFRYRMSSQLLLSTRGVFIEKIRGRDGRVIALSLLPPQSTAPIPDAKNFVAGYHVIMPTGQPVVMKTDDVIWIRRPHPLDPYLSMTPLESAGIAVEIENLAKVYNRNFLLNDGRPGGLLVLRGEVDDDDKDELRNRFKGNITKVGQTTVISSDDGADFVDTSSSPRDAAYIQMRQITKEEILASFGVPESVIGNASGRTFSNANEEHQVFWNETMLPHLEIMARALDELDELYYVDFDTSQVPSLILYDQERQRYLMQEFQTGLISTNEYRIASGRKDTQSDLADSLLMNPNLTPIANTLKKMEEPPQAQVAGPPGAPGAPMPGAAPTGAPGQPAMPPDPTTMEGAMALAAQNAAPEAGGAAPETGAAPVPEGQMSYGFGGIQSKSADEWSIKASQSLVRWTEILDRSLERVFERQQRVVLEKISGVKARKSLSDGTLDTSQVWSADTWAKQLDEDIRPVLTAIITDAQSLYSEKSLIKAPLTREDILAHIDAQMVRIKSANSETFDEINSALFASFSIPGTEQRATAFRSSVVTTFTNLLGKKRGTIAEDESRRAWAIGSQL